MSTPTFTMFHADCVGNAVNCLYSHKVEIAEAHERTSGIHMMYL